MSWKAGHTDNSDHEGAVGLVPSRISNGVRDDFCANWERLSRAKNGCDLDNNLRNESEYILLYFKPEDCLKSEGVLSLKVLIGLKMNSSANNPNHSFICAHSIYVYCIYSNTDLYWTIYIYNHCYSVTSRFPDMGLSLRWRTCALRII